MSLSHSHHNNQMMQRRYWSVEEDQALKTIVSCMSNYNWTLISLKLNSTIKNDRNAKQCRERWMNNIAKNRTLEQEWTGSEDRIILQQFIRYHNLEKNKWIIIAGSLIKAQLTPKHRIPNEIKNRFYSLIRKGIRRINNKLSRPVSPEEIRLIKPATISKLLLGMEIEDSRDLIQDIYAMSQQENKVEISQEKLQKILKLVVSQNRQECQKQDPSNTRLRKRKSSLSTQDQQKLSKLILTKSTTPTTIPQNEKQVPSHNQYDDIDIFLGTYVGESVSLQFQDINFGI